MSAAASGAGKTFLVKALCGVLPGAVSAKSGHAPKKAAKQVNYFRSIEELSDFVEKNSAAAHCVIESNSWALNEKSDIHIHIDHAAAGHRLREDAPALLRHAQIVLGSQPKREKWLLVLSSMLKDDLLTDSVLGVLVRQCRYFV